MNDIVERLKDAENATHALFNYIFQDARAEIERLRIENEALRAEIIHIKEVKFPRKAQAVADGWRGKLEAAEKERDDVAQQLVQSEIGKREISEAHNTVTRRLSVLADENAALRSKIAGMEKQEPVGVLHVGSCYGEELEDWEFEADQRVCDRLNERHVTNPTSLKLYALPGAQPTPSAVAYLDLGVGGYMDIGTDLTDEALAAIPKGRHMLGIIGTYGVDGYLPAQIAPSFADAYQGAMEEVAIWKKRALEAEDLNRKFVAEINGPTYMGEPVHSKPDCGEAGHDEGRCGNRQCLPGAQGE